MCCTMTIGTGRLAGSAGRISASAFGPPVETPIAITPIVSIGDVEDTGGDEGTSGDEDTGSDDRPTVAAGVWTAGGRTPSGFPKALIFGSNCSRTRSTASVTLPTLAGFVT